MPVEIKKGAIGVCNRYVVRWFLFFYCLSRMLVPASAATEEQAASFSRAVALSKSTTISDQAAARIIFAELSSQGIREAKFNLGTLLAEGKGGPVDDIKAKALFEEVAANGFPKVYFNLGLFHEKGRGGPVDLAEAVRCYERAAAAGDATAKFNLGGMYADGRGVMRDVAKAKRYYDQAGKAGFAAGYYEYGLLCSRDFSIYTDEFDARWNFDCASDTGHAGASYFLYRYVMAGGKNTKLPASIYLSLAEKSGAEGHMQVALLLLEGRHCRREIEQGMVWLRKAVDMNLPEAKLLLAKYLIKGEIIEQDISRALRLLKEAEARMDAEAWYLRGTAEMEVAATPEAMDTAAESWKRASDMGFLNAHLAMARRLRAHVNPDIRQVIKYLNRAADMSFDAKYELACLLLECPFQFRDVDFALLLLGDLANLGQGKAAFRLYQFHLGDDSKKSHKDKAPGFLTLAVSKEYYPAYALQAKVRLEQYLKGDPTGAGDAHLLLKKAAESRDLNAISMLSEYHADSRYGSVDMAEAYRWRLLAASFTPDEKNASFIEWEKKTSMTIREEGEYLARKTYDRWISDRIAVEDREISRYRKQAETGVVQAQLGLARAYELGKKVPRNLSIALAWYLVAGKNGSKEATEATSLLRKRMTAGQVAEANITADTLSR